jgi:hypothetical protein
MRDHHRNLIDFHTQFSNVVGATEGSGGRRGQTEVAMKFWTLKVMMIVGCANGRERGPTFAGEIRANVGLVTLRKRRTMGTNLGQNQAITPMAASLSRAPGHMECGTLFIVVVIEL